MEDWEEALNSLMNSIPKINRTPQEWEEIQRKNIEEDAIFYANRDEKGYALK